MKNILKTLHSKSGLVKTCQLQSHLSHVFRSQSWFNATRLRLERTKSLYLNPFLMQGFLTVSLLIITVISLTSCGGAADTHSPEDPGSIDRQAPDIESLTPANNTETSINTKNILIKFTEEIDDKGIILSDVFSISPSIEGNWHYDKASKRVQFTVNDSVTALPLDQTYLVTINTALKDLAGNPLADEYQFVFFTPKTYAISGTIQGLTGKIELQLNATQPNAASILTDSLALEAQDKDISYAFSKKLILDSDFEVVIVSQPASDQFCAISQNSRQVSTNTKVTISCSPVHPQFIKASNWNDYMNETDGNPCVSGPECLHGGERRQVTVPQADTCENLHADDILSAFEWQCITDNSVTPPKIQMHSVKLKDNKHLSDLINFDTRSWKPNKVTVKNNNDTLLDTRPSIWWNNPIIEHKSGNKLQSPGSIYVINSKTSNRITVEKSKIAVLARPFSKNGDVFTVTVQHAGNSITIPNNTNHFWLEGRFQTQGEITHNANVINISGSRHSVLRNVVVFGAEKDGIKINASQYITLHEVGAHKNGENGIFISSNTQNNVLRNIKTGSNSANGVHIAGTINSAHNVFSANNGENGVLISGAKNVITQAATYNNAQHGLLIDGTNNNTLSLINATGNSQNGITLIDSHYTVLTHLSLVNNDFSGLFAENSNNTTLVNINATLNEKNGLTLNDTANTVVKNAVIAFNGEHGITSTLKGDVNFTGTTEVGLSTTFNCQIADSSECPDTITALADTTTLANSFVGRIAEGLPAPSNHQYEQAEQWTMLQNRYQSWGNLTDIDTPPSPSYCEAISINNCALWDWSLTPDDLVFLNKNTETNEQASITHHYSDSDATFFTNSFELIGRPQGNGNGLCEAAEACVIAPNVGAYQGHGQATADNTDG